MEKTEEEKQPVVEETKAKEEKGGAKERQKKKEERLAARQKKVQEVEEEFKIDPEDPCFGRFGELEINRSQSDPEKRYEVKYTKVKNLDESLDKQEITIVGRL